MSYSTLSQFKDYLGIAQSDTSKDSVLTEFLNASYSKLNHICGVDSFNKWTYTQMIEKRWIFDTARWLEFYLKNKPVSSIDKINGSSDSLVKWTDYLIIYERRAVFKKLELDDRWFLNVEYTAWFQTIPDDLKLMEMMLGSWMYQEEWNEGVSEYRLWDETIKFGSKVSSNGILTPDDQYFSFTALLDKYKNFNLPL